MSTKPEVFDSVQIITETISTSAGDSKSVSYSKRNFLGKGGFARVYEMVNNETGEVFAGKMIQKDLLSKSRTKHKLMSEIKIHRSLQHTNIVKFQHYFETDEFVYILLELCPNQSLSDLVRRRKRLTELESQCYLLQIIAGLKYMHSNRVIHRDIKLGNIFLSDKMELKIGDFGLSAKLEYEGERKRTICGTPNYIAPEILDGRIGHSYECDVWSFGVLMYTLLIGRPPFETKDVKTTYRRIKMNLYSYPENISVSMEARNLIGAVLVIDPMKRLTFDEILKHDFFQKNPIPRYLPVSTLAIPPSQNFLKQFMVRNTENVVIRASSQETQKENSEEKPLKRNNSKESRRPTNPEGKPSKYESAYTGNDNDGPELWVKKWLDYSSRYGVGYLLSNNCVGVVFNDSTRIIINPPGDTFQYISSSKHGETISTHSANNFPQEYHKKVLIMQLFRKQLLGKEAGGNDIEKPYTYVKKWASTPHSAIFRLTNKLIQVWFTDATELLLSSEKKHVTFVNKSKEIYSCPLATALDCDNKQLVKRLKYSKEVLANMLKANNN